MDSVNATMLLVVVTVLVVGFYLFTLKPREDVTGAVAPLHMVVCVVSFILYACVERWWSMQLDTNPDAASICNLMVLNKIAVAALMADMVTSFTGLFSVSQYVDYVILGCWFYVAAMAAVSVAVKMTRHREELVFRLYILFPVYYYGGQKGSGALTWLEQHTGISMRSLWSLKFIKMILPSWRNGGAPAGVAVHLCGAGGDLSAGGAVPLRQSGAGGYPGARPALQASGAL